MDSIISITFNHKIINEKNYKSYTNNALLKILKKPMFYIRPPSFEKLKKLISTLNIKKDYNTITKIIGLTPSGERIEIKDEETYKKDISIFVVLTIRISKIVLPDINTKKLFNIESNFLDNLRHSINININKNQKIDENDKFNDLKKSINSEMEQMQNKLIDNFMRKDSDDMLNLNRSISDIMDKIKNKNIFNINNLRQSLQIFKKNVYKKQTNLIKSIHYNRKSIGEVMNLMKKNSYDQSENVQEDEEDEKIDFNHIDPKKSINDAIDFFNNMEEINFV